MVGADTDEMSNKINQSALYIMITVTHAIVGEMIIGGKWCVMQLTSTIPLILSYIPQWQQSYIFLFHCWLIKANLIFNFIYEHFMALYPL